MEQQPPTDPKAASTYSSTTVTSTTGAAAEPQPSIGLLVVKTLQGELQRKLDELQDVRKAYGRIANQWTDEKNYEVADIQQSGYIVQNCWLGADNTWNFKILLEYAVAKLEEEIREIRQELKEIAGAREARN